MPTSFRARYVFPVDRPPIEHGVVTIDGERIVAVGDRPAGENSVDLGPVALLPGFVNAHCHLEFSHLRRPLGRAGMPLADWIRAVIAERGRADYSAPLAIEDGLHESLAHGVTGIGDITTVDVSAQYFPRVDLTLFAEVIAFSRARAASAFSALALRLSSQHSQVDYRRRATADIHFGISPHAPYTVSPGLVAKLVDVARGRGLPVAMHIAESREELEFLDRGTGPFQELLDERSMWDAEAIPRGSRPLDYLQMLAAAPRALVIHGNYLAADELEFLAARRDSMSLVYCPRTHEYFRHPRYPLNAALDASVRVALGTDSRASNPDLDLLAEMQFVRSAYAEIDPLAILKMGTLAAAEALGREAEIGSLYPGKLANMVALELSDEGGNSPARALESIFSGGVTARTVWLRGAQFRK